MLNPRSTFEVTILESQQGDWYLHCHRHENGTRRQSAFLLRDRDVTRARELAADLVRILGPETVLKETTFEEDLDHDFQQCREQIAYWREHLRDQPEGTPSRVRVEEILWDLYKTLADLRSCVREPKMTTKPSVPSPEM